MENNIKVSPSHELLEELKTAVFNYDFLAIEASLRKGAKYAICRTIIRAGRLSYGLAESLMKQRL